VPVKPLVSLRLRALDAADALAGRRDPRTPPRRLQGAVGAGDFAAVGEEFLGHLVELCDLRPGERVLDAGCGIGRLARALSAYLGPHGSYAGFDVDAAAIAWCARRYADLPRFGFVHADLRNRRYNPRGAGDPLAFRFPYEDGSFDVAVMASLLTHLVAPQARHYLREARRVLAAGGRLLASAFVLEDEAAPAPAIAFGAPRDGMAVADPDVPEEAVAYERAWLEAALRDAGLHLVALHPGRWRGGEGRSFQDLVIAHA
jgi:ubiquinone/menaquinone biosynthesis C-methylase UbiE